jgi:transketolase
MHVWRPCDSVETLVAWTRAIERADGPSSLLLSRDPLPFQQRRAEQLAAISRGGYTLSEAAGTTPSAVIIAAGSEIGVALSAQRELATDGIAVSVVSMPCTEIFDAQDQSYRDGVLPRGIPRVAVEAGVSDYWRKYVGLEGAVVGVDRFGESAPAADLFKFFGFTAENVAAAVRSVL